MLISCWLQSIPKNHATIGAATILHVGTGNQRFQAVLLASPHSGGQWRVWLIDGVSGWLMDQRSSVLTIPTIGDFLIIIGQFETDWYWLLTGSWNDPSTNNQYYNWNNIPSITGINKETNEQLKGNISINNWFLESPVPPWSQLVESKCDTVNRPLAWKVDHH